MFLYLRYKLLILDDENNANAASFCFSLYNSDSKLLRYRDVHAGNLIILEFSN